MYHEGNNKSSISTKMRHSRGSCIIMNNQEKNTYVREKLTQALIQLLQEKNIEDISICELTQRAQVGRASFYRNYQTLSDILYPYDRWLVNTWGRSMTQIQPPIFLICSDGCFSTTKTTLIFTCFCTATGWPELCWTPFRNSVACSRSWETKKPMKRLSGHMAFTAGFWNGWSRYGGVCRRYQCYAPESVNTEGYFQYSCLKNMGIIKSYFVRKNSFCTPIPAHSLKSKGVHCYLPHETPWNAVFSRGFFVFASYKIL